MPAKINLLLIFLAHLIILNPDASWSQNASFLSFNRDTDVRFCITSSPNGQNVYAGGLHSSAAFQKLPNGSLKTVRVINNHHDGFLEIGNIIDMVISPDGRHLYALSITNQTLLIFERDAAAGNLLLIETYQDSVFRGQHGLLPAVEYRYKLVISSNGENLYWLNHDLGVLTVFRRNPISGRLSTIQAIRKAGQDQSTIPTSIAISSDGRFLYGTSLNGQILFFKRDSVSGKISLADSFATNIHWWPNAGIAIAPDNAFLFATSFNNDKLLIFIRDAVSGGLTLYQTLHQQPSPLAVWVALDGDHIYVGRNGDIATVGRDSDSGEFFIVAALGINFSFPSGLSFSADGKNLYVTSEYSQSLNILEREFDTGKLTLQQKLNYNLGGTDRLHLSRAVAVSPDNQFLYVAARYEDAGVSAFSRNQDDGRISLIKSFPLTSLSNLAMSPDGRHLYTNSVEDNRLEAFAIDQAAGELQHVQTRNDNLNQDLFWESTGTMSFSPEGSNMYLEDNLRLLVYRRNPHTGELDLLQTLHASDYHAGQMRALAVSPEGAHVYWSGHIATELPGYQIAVFSRDDATGELTFLQQQNFTGMMPSAGLKISPDGRHVYAGLETEEGDPDPQTGIAVFSCEAQTGELAWLEMILYRGFYHCDDIEISQDGRALYVSIDDIGSFSARLAFYDRDAETGKLALTKWFRSWSEGVMACPSRRIWRFRPTGLLST